MQLKPTTAIVVLSLVVASLLVSGCTTSTTNQTPSATPSTVTHDAFLEKYLAAYKSAWYAEKDVNITMWNLTWTNSTSVRLECTEFNKSLNEAFNYVQTYLVFPTSQEATNYLAAMNKTAYSLASTAYTSGGTYQNVTGQAPQIYKYYKWNEANLNNLPEYTLPAIKQMDNLIVIHTGKQI